MTICFDKEMLDVAADEIKQQTKVEIANPHCSSNRENIATEHITMIIPLMSVLSCMSELVSRNAITIIPKLMTNSIIDSIKGKYPGPICDNDPTDNIEDPNKNPTETNSKQIPGTK